ncbi:MAG: hypothetical protein COY42_23015 [Armatimonadetes bacterium CG_4_10_14_0_8_um_filter_66_14]|nr:MAG: hypothetical protein COS65_26955 [Armatimonadetes bacterium CG06_land_8_20_14_3_00_66_21]PIW19906.1 MAG: hypothetical protein COW34_03095 [Armatimonadetes bacterium CG17_big_fil_post_rev_8_21_14_2_50_66_6]PIZ38543.1 MAG: hypothetical protein COY42_23015 [Armatimonadetes bacterium CG_4_10_14_0_8_um_filter_66_14]PJB68024.1 MAG: hypothetical protein CO096_15145 [Armatimonadetes bacterium CG_4_9_14_3_um_filter_66_14]
MHMEAGATMVTMTASQLRKELFAALRIVSDGEPVSVNWKGREVARLMPAPSPDWRDAVRQKPRLLTSPDEAFAPMGDVWQEYVP